MVTTSEDEAFSFTIEDLPVAEFYHRLFEGLGSLRIEISINPISFDLDKNKLDADTYHRTCNQRHVRRFHRALVRVDRIFEEFAGRFNGKTSPVALFRHSFDLAVRRFSDRRVSLPEETDRLQARLTRTRSYSSVSGLETKTYASLPSTLTLRPSPRA
ncbi:MAG TPA: DUF5996 family protein [Rubrobacteraceae bacterium]|nr:DUF5996 family protein [Rubrobacteraceae bacterium]